MPVPVPGIVPVLGPAPVPVPGPVMGMVVEVMVMGEKSAVQISDILPVSLYGY